MPTLLQSVALPLRFGRYLVICRLRRGVACWWAYCCVEECELRRLLRDVMPSALQSLF